MDGGRPLAKKIVIRSAAILIVQNLAGKRLNAWIAREKQYLAARIVALTVATVNYLNIMRCWKCTLLVGIQRKD